MDIFIHFGYRVSEPTSLHSPPPVLCRSRACGQELCAWVTEESGPSVCVCVCARSTRASPAQPQPAGTQGQRVSLGPTSALSPVIVAAPRAGAVIQDTPSRHLRGRQPSFPPHHIVTTVRVGFPLPVCPPHGEPWLKHPPKWLFEKREFSECPRESWKWVHFLPLGFQNLFSRHGDTAPLVYSWYYVVNDSIPPGRASRCCPFQATSPLRGLVRGGSRSHPPTSCDIRGVPWSET